MVLARIGFLQVKNGRDGVRPFVIDHILHLCRFDVVFCINQLKKAGSAKPTACV